MFKSGLNHGKTRMFIERTVQHLNNQLKVTSKITAPWFVPRLLFSRTGLFSRVVQLLFGITTRACKVLGLNASFDALQRWRLKQTDLYRTLCLESFELALKSGKYSTLLDFGAHTGEQVIQASQFMNVIAYEPDPRAFTLLSANVDRIRPTTHHIALHQSAVSTSHGRARLGFLDDAPEKTGGSTLVLTKERFSGQYGIECSTTDAGEILNQLDSPEATILKMDIEGAEYKVLHHLVRNTNFRRLGLVYVEYHERKLKWQSLHGFTLYAHLRLRGVPRSRLIEWL